MLSSLFQRCHLSPVPWNNLSLPCQSVATIHFEKAQKNYARVSAWIKSTAEK